MNPQSIAQIITPGAIQSELRYYQSKSPGVRAFQDMDPATRGNYASQISAGFPDQAGSEQVDETINVEGANALATMRYRKDAGISWVPAWGMPALPATATGILTADPNNIPKGAIIVTTEFGPPAADLIVSPSVRPFRWVSSHSPNINDLNGVGSAWWPNEDDASPVLACWKPEDGSQEYMKCLVLGYMGASTLLWVRMA